MILDIARKAKEAAKELALLSTKTKNQALLDMAEALEKAVGWFRNNGYAPQ